MKIHPAANIFPLLLGQELQALADDIRANGQHEPIWLDSAGVLLDGRNRLAACKLVGAEPLSTTYVGNDPVGFIVSANLHRRHLDASQRAAVAFELLPFFEEQARERKMASGREAGPRGAILEKRQKGLGKIAQTDPHRARDDAARAVGVSPRHVESAKALKRDAPKMFDEVKAGTLTLSKAGQVLKAAKKARVAEALRREPTPEPTGRFRVIAIDPPWKYSNRAEDLTHRARNPYPDMDVEAICALPVAARAEDDCVLWLWTTNGFMREAYQCLDAWGFAPKTILTWAKDRIGTGDWLRGQTEHCILAVRGKPTVTLTNQSTILHAPMREHSRKPDEFFRLVESLCPGTKLELFAREPRKGWQVWGAESGKFA